MIHFVVRTQKPLHGQWVQTDCCGEDMPFSGEINADPKSPDVCKAWRRMSPPRGMRILAFSGEDAARLQKAYRERLPLR